MSSVLTLIAGGILVYTVYMLLDKTHMSKKVIESKKRMVPAWAGEPSNELSNPLNIRGAFNSNDPVSDTDIGPFGIERKMRNPSRLDPLSAYPTFGDTIESY